MKFSGLLSVAAGLLAAWQGVNGAETQSSDQQALLAFYNGLNSPNLGWDTATGLCGQNGITCQNGRVTQIRLPQQNLKGNISPQLGALSELQILDLGSNQLSGSLPKELGQLQKLETLIINLGNLEGSIPTELGSLSSLRIVLLEANRLTGSLPSELGGLTNLERLFLENNQLSGTLPKELGALSNLVVLSLQGNPLTGPLPVEYNQLKKLESLYLISTGLSGTIPTQYAEMSSLSLLELASNKLTGVIPSELGNLASMSKLNLANNKLVGAIPVELGQLTSLTHLNLADNNLAGSIPQQLGEHQYTEIKLLGTNNLCPVIDFSSWGTVTDFEGTKDCTPCGGKVCLNGGKCLLSDQNQLGFTCECPSYAQGTYCELVDAASICSGIECGFGSCVPGENSYTCQCDEGYSLDPERIVCSINIDECATGTAGCSQDANCTDLEGGFICTCNPGFAGDGKTCTPFEGCDSNPCQNNGACTNLPFGEYTCNCNGTGFSGINCDLDLNECGSDFSNCQPGYMCVDTSGGFECQLCQENTYYSDSFCRQCPSNSISPPGTQSLDGCICTAGFGFYQGICIACDPGTYKEGPGNHECSSCGDGQRSSLGATSCSQQELRSSNRIPWWVILIICLVILALLLLVLFLVYYFYRQKRRDEKLNSTMDSEISGADSYNHGHQPPMATA